MNGNIDSVHVRAWTRADARAIADIYNYYVEHTTATFELECVRVEEMLRRLTLFARVAPPLVAVDSLGRLSGYAYIHPWKDKAAYGITAESTVYVSPGQCGKGVGRKLMLALMDNARSGGLRNLIACITAENAGSRRFHESLGFSQVSNFAGVGCKFGRMLDVTDYQLTL